MRSGSGIRRTAARRFATVMAAVGALLMSSGIALMAAPMSADATASAGGNVVQKNKPPKENLKDWVCKYVGTPGVDEHLKQGNDGLVWVSTHASQGSWFKRLLPWLQIAAPMSFTYRQPKLSRPWASI